MGVENDDDTDSRPEAGAPIPVVKPDKPGSQGAAALPNRSMDRWTWTDKAGKKKKMTPRQIATVQNYVANGGNGRKAAEDAGYIQGNDSLSITAGRTLNIARNEGILERELGEAGIGRPVQLHKLSDIVNGRQQWSDTQTTYDADGNVLKSTRITRQPTARDITAAIATADRISGAREQRKVQADVVSAELKALIKKHCPVLDGIKLADRPVEAHTTHAMALEGEGGIGAAV
jgi:hypothetical protein